MKKNEQLFKSAKLDASDWKYGLFYFNKEDKRIFPPKKPAWMGWTINFANPLSIVVNVIVICLTMLAVHYLF